MNKPLYVRPVLLFQIRTLHRLATRLINSGCRMRNRANRLTDEAVRAYKVEQS